MQKILIITLFMTTLLASAIAIHYKSDHDRRDAQLQHSEQNILYLADKISKLAKDIRVATYPTACDKASIEIMGDSCDVGNYMEWAGPELEHEAEALWNLLKDEKE